MSYAYSSCLSLLTQRKPDARHVRSFNQTSIHHHFGYTLLCAGKQPPAWASCHTSSLHCTTHFQCRCTCMVGQHHSSKGLNFPTLLWDHTRNHHQHNAPSLAVCNMHMQRVTHHATVSRSTPAVITNLNCCFSTAPPTFPSFMHMTAQPPILLHHLASLHHDRLHPEAQAPVCQLLPHMCSMSPSFLQAHAHQHTGAA